MDQKIKKNNNFSKKNKSKNKKTILKNSSNNRKHSLTEEEIDEAFKFNSNDIMLNRPVLQKIEMKDLCEVNEKYGAKFKELSEKLNNNKEIYFHLFNSRIVILK
jgi:hypothetical protein